MSAEEPLFVCRTYPTGPRYVAIALHDVEPGHKVYVERTDDSKQVYYVELTPQALRDRLHGAKAGVVASSAGDTGVPDDASAPPLEHPPHHPEHDGPGYGGSIPVAAAPPAYAPYQDSNASGDEGYGERGPLLAPRRSKLGRSQARPGAPLRCTHTEAQALQLLAVASVVGGLMAMGPYWFGYPAVILLSVLVAEVLAHKYAKAVNVHLVRAAIVFSWILAFLAFMSFMFTAILMTIDRERPIIESLSSEYGEWSNNGYLAWLISGPLVLVFGIVWLFLAPAALFNVRKYVLAALQYEEDCRTADEDTWVYFDPSEDSFPPNYNVVFGWNIALTIVLLNALFWGWMLLAIWLMVVTVMLLRCDHVSSGLRSASACLGILSALTCFASGIVCIVFWFSNQSQWFVYAVSAAVVYVLTVPTFIVHTVALNRIRHISQAKQPKHRGRNQRHVEAPVWSTSQQHEAPRTHAYGGPMAYEGASGSYDYHAQGGSQPQRRVDRGPTTNFSVPYGAK